MSLASRDKISIGTAIIIGVNSMIGAGIFGATAILGTKIGPASIVTFLAAFIAVWFIALSFARVAYLFPQEGSFYNYAGQWGGHRLGLIVGGLYIFGVLTSMGLLSKLLSEYIYNIYPHCSPMCLGLISIALLTGLNLAGAVLSKIGQYILIALTIYPLVATTALCLTNASFDNLLPFAPYGWGPVFAGTKIAVFSFFGFESIASLFSIIQRPEKSVPQALKISLLIVGASYILFISSIMLGIPQEIFCQYPHVTIPEALMIAFPDYTSLIASIHISIIFSIMGTIHAVIWAASELLIPYLSMMKISYIKKQLSSHKSAQKKTALLAGMIVATTFLSVENLTVFISITDTCVLLAFIASIISLFFVKSERKSKRILIAILGLIFATAILSYALQTLWSAIMAQPN